MKNQNIRSQSTRARQLLKFSIYLAAIALFLFKSAVYTFAGPGAALWGRVATTDSHGNVIGHNGIPVVHRFRKPGGCVDPDENGHCNEWGPDQWVDSDPVTTFHAYGSVGCFYFNAQNQCVDIPGEGDGFYFLGNASCGDTDHSVYILANSSGCPQTSPSPVTVGANYGVYRNDFSCETPTPPPPTLTPTPSPTIILTPTPCVIGPTITPHPSPTPNPNFVRGFFMQLQIGQKK